MPKKGRIPWDDAASVGENARAQLPSVAGAYFRAGRKLMKGSPSIADLHAFRLKTKRLRYTLELFRACYGSTLEQRLDRLREMQNLLGDISDCGAALRIATRALSERSSELRKLERYLKSRSGRLTTAFRKLWREKFDAPGQEDWWTGYLARKR